MCGWGETSENNKIKLKKKFEKYHVPDKCGPQGRLGCVGAFNENEALWWDFSPSSPKAINVRGRFKNQLSIAFSA